MSLSPKEIMKGAVVSYEGKTRIVKGVMDYIILEGTKEWIGGSLMNGEPLTEEWLMKLGFEWNDTFYNKGKLSITLAGDSSHPKGRVYFNSWAIWNHQPEYVHQLQVLFFSLTGEHLIVPKLPKS